MIVSNLRVEVGIWRSPGESLSRRLRRLFRTVPILVVATAVNVIKTERMPKLDLPPRLVSFVARCDRRDLAAKLVGLSLLPEFQANYPRILTLLHLALARARGARRTSASELGALLNGLDDHDIGRSEDPAEDVFVSNVATFGGNYRIFNGVFPASAFSLERLLDAVFGDDFPARGRLWAQCRALLMLSDAIAERRGLNANDYAESMPQRTRWPLRLPPLVEAARSVRFAPDDLAGLGIDIDALAPFLLADSSDLAEGHFFASPLCRRPLLPEAGGSIALPAPSYVSSALRLHLAHAIVGGDAPRTSIGRFHDLQFARWLLFDLPLRGEHALPQAQAGLPRPGFELPGTYAHATVEFDDDKLAHILVLGCDWRTPPQTVHQVGRASPDLERRLQAHLRACRDTLVAARGAERGLSVVVYDSPGWSVRLDAGRDPGADWFIVALSAYAFSTLLGDPRFTLLDLWKLIRAERALEASGIRLVAWPDPLNRWAIWRDWGFSFQPGDLDLRGFDSVLADTSLIQRQVAMTRRIAHAHSAPTPSGEWQAVERVVRGASPSIEFEKPLFMVPLSAAQGEMHGVVEVGHGAWWVTMARPPLDPGEHAYLFLLWQSATEWLLRLAASAGGRLARSADAIEINLLPVPASITDAPDEVQCIVHDRLAAVRVVLPASLIDAMATADNRGEWILVRALAEAVALAHRLPMASADLDAWTDDVTADPALKMMHVTLTGDAGLVLDALTGRRPLRPLQAPDMAAAFAGMRERLAAQADSVVTPETETVEGEEPVRDVLRAAVDARWRRCRDRLEQLDRAATLRLISRMIEAVHSDRVVAERSALARTRFYAESGDLEAWSIGATARRDIAFRAYRVAAEMAVSTSPLTGGRLPGISDIDEVAAEITYLIRNAEDSDAVRFGLIEPKLRFAPNGALKMAKGDANAFTRDYLKACLGESIAIDIDTYPLLFEDIPPLEDEPDDEEGDVAAAFHAEFGLTLRTAARAAGALQQIGVDLASDVVALRRSELLARLAADAPEVGEADLAAFLKSFGLASREAWDAPPPEPWQRDDVWPWYYERRLSLMLRPVLILSDEVDPLLIYGVRQLDMGLRYASILLERGVWPKGKLQSAAARAYVDAEINRRGDAFEQEIAALVEEGGWRAFSRLAMTRFGAPKRLGDLDALAVSPDGTVWIVIECKWFGAARTPREIANWLQDYHGKAGDKLDRHLQRHAWIDRNRDSVATALNLKSPAQILGRVATTNPVPLAFREGLPPAATVITRRQLPEALGACE